MPRRRRRGRLLPAIGVAALVILGAGARLLLAGHSARVAVVSHATARTTPPPVAPTTLKPSLQFTDPAGHFQVQFDAYGVPFKLSSPASRTVPASWVQWNMAVGETNTSESVGYWTYPPGAYLPAHYMLDATVAAAAKGFPGGVERSETFGLFQGFQSVDALIAGTYPNPASPGSREMRAILAGDRIYILSVTSSNDPSDVFANFAGSLRIVGGA